MTEEICFKPAVPPHYFDAGIPTGTEGRRVQHYVFDMGDSVYIKAIQRPARVIALLIDFEGIQYRVSYWLDGKRESTYLPSDELELKESK